ncbi:MAG: arginyltransferase [Planctomycetales bacterium]|nr:arginyltransferase [Planctomycetales bacterium]
MNPINIQDDYRLLSPASECSYLPSETSVMDYRIILALNSNEYEHLLERGWRRQGVHVFRPACPACNKCRSLRVNVAEFRPSKSQRRVLRQNQDVQLIVQRPVITYQHIEVFNRYHQDMSQRRGWRFRQVDPQEYYQSFLSGDYDFAREFLYLRDGQLLGVGLVDVTDNAMSSVYFFHDPAWRNDSPGTFSALKELEFAAARNIPFVYLGYWIRENQSMQYKNRFRPHELLDEYGSDHANPNWKSPEV